MCLLEQDLFFFLNIGLDLFFVLIMCVCLSVERKNGFDKITAASCFKFYGFLLIQWHVQVEFLSYNLYMY